MKIVLSLFAILLSISAFALSEQEEQIVKAGAISTCFYYPSSNEGATAPGILNCGDQLFERCKDRPDLRDAMNCTDGDAG